MTTKNVSISWKAFAMYGKQSSSCVFAIESDLDDLSLCEAIYSATNLYRGELWTVIEDVLPLNRSHTALSVGDSITIDGIEFECADFGFEQVA